jgi:phage major head subunit gpT-like protein
MILDGNWQDALEPIAKKSFQVGLKEIPAEKSMLFDVTKSDKLTETYLEIGDVGSMEEFNGSVPYDDIAQGYKMTVTAKEMAKGIKIQRRFVRTDQLDIVKSLPKMLGLAARRRMALDVFFGYNNAFNTSLTTLDGLALCSTAHTSTNGGSNQGNSGSTAFSAVSVEATRLLMKKFLSNTDQRFEVMPDMLIVPPDLEEAAYELTASSGKVDTANNNKNFHQGKWKVLVSDWLEDTNNWFMVDSDLLKQFAVWNDVDTIDFAQSEDFDGIAAKYRAYMFYGFGFRDWRFLYGHNV